MRHRADADELRRTVSTFLNAPLNLQAGLSFSARLIRASTRRLLCFVAHPCVADARSMRILPKSSLKRCRRTGSVDRLLQWTWNISKGQRPTPEDATAAEQYWNNRIGIDPVPTVLPHRGPRPLRKRFAAEAVRFSLGAREIDAIARAAERLHTGFVNVCFTAYLVVLRRWTQQETLHVGRVVDGRKFIAERTVGPFENSLPVRVDFQPDQSFAVFVHNVDEQLLNDARYEGLPFDRIAKRLQSRAIRRAIRYFRRCSDAPTRHHCSSIRTLGRWLKRTSSSASKRLTTPCSRLTDRPHSGEVRILFDRGAAGIDVRSQRFGSHFLRILSAVADDPEAQWDRVRILDDEEVRRQLEVLNPLPTAATGRTVIDMFRSAVQRNPRAPAVSFAGTTLTYEALDRQTEALAALLRDRGVCE